MKHFRRITSAVDVEPLLDEITAVAGAWELNDRRQAKIDVQREAQSIPIRGLVKSSVYGRKRRDVHASRYTTISKQFRRVRAFLEAFATGKNADPGRAKIVRSRSGHCVHAHRDRGEYYRLRDRYHLVLKSNGSYLKSGGEAVVMLPGEVWWFDNKQVHETRNDGPHERIHIIFDLLPHSNKFLVEEQEQQARNIESAA